METLKKQNITNSFETISLLKDNNKYYLLKEDIKGNIVRKIKKEEICKDLQALVNSVDSLTISKRERNKIKINMHLSNLSS